MEQMYELRLLIRADEVSLLKAAFQNPPEHADEKIKTLYKYIFNMITKPDPISINTQPTI